MLPSDQRRQTALDGNLKATAGSSLSHDVIQGEGRGESFQWSYAEILTLKQALHKLMGRSADNYRIRIGLALDAGCNVRRFAECKLFVSC